MSKSGSERLEDQVFQEGQAARMPEHDVGGAPHLLHPLDRALDYIGKAPTGIKNGILLTSCPRPPSLAPPSLA